MEASATVQQLKPTNFQRSNGAKPAIPGLISWPQFERKYLSLENSFKYELVNGKVEKTKRNMHQTQLLILFNLRKFFASLVSAGKIDGVLESEIDAHFLENVHRRPDVSYYSMAQLHKIGQGVPQIPDFVIEIISNSDQVNRVVDKMQNYRDAGVKVVWQIYPNQKEVNVFSGDGLFQMSVIKGARICTCTAVLPDFSLSANEIFKLL